MVAQIAPFESEWSESRFSARPAAQRPRFIAGGVMRFTPPVSPPSLSLILLGLGYVLRVKRPLSVSYAGGGGNEREGNSERTAIRDQRAPDPCHAKSA